MARPKGWEALTPWRRLIAQRRPYIDQVMFVAQGKVTIGPPDEVINSEALSRIFDAPIEVLRDSRGRVFVVGLEEQVSHPHEHPGSD